MHLLSRESEEAGPGPLAVLEFDDFHLTKSVAKWGDDDRRDATRAIRLACNFLFASALREEGKVGFERYFEPSGAEQREGFVGIRSQLAELWRFRVKYLEAQGTGHNPASKSTLESLSAFERRYATERIRPGRAGPHSRRHARSL